MSTQARQIALQGAIRLSNRSSVPTTPTPTSCATSSNAALSGGSNRATALSLNACPYFAIRFLIIAPGSWILSGRQVF
jgi:hypothetical protein